MKYNLTFFIYFLLTILSCNGMEKNLQQETILREITVIQEPMDAQYIKKDLAVIVGKNGCSIIKLSTNQEVIKINSDPYDSIFSFFTLSPDKKKIALSYKNYINIHNTKTGDKIWSTYIDSIRSFIFST